MYVSVDIKNNVQKDSTLLWFFLSKSPGGHAISHKKHLELPVVSYPLIAYFTLNFLSYILHWYACGADRRLGVRSRDYQNFSDGWIIKFS